MRFQVPQFLEIEDKIFGPFTFKEFVYLVGGGGLCFVLYKILGFLLGFIPIAVIAGFSLALVFYKPNNQPFLNMVEAGFVYLMQDRFYIWKRKKITQDKISVLKSKHDKNFNLVGEAEENDISNTLNATQLNTGKLKDLAWGLDILDKKK
ncbi:MAG: PrgI family protein [Patescibacteria group bacterium]